MVPRLNIIIIFFLFIIILTVPTRSSGKTKKKKSNPPKLSDHIDKNPFLQNRSTDGNVDYHGNPFLTNGLELHVSSPKNNPFLQHTTSENNFTDTISTNKPHISINVANEKIPVDNDVQTNSYTPTKTKSELKCEEYERQILGTTDVLSLVGTDSEVIKITNQKCGVPNRLVLGGENALLGEFPHMTALGTRAADGTFSFSCGGTLIAPEWVLTAAHCTYGPKSPTDVRIGLNDLKDKLQGITTTINKIVRHPNYKPPAMYADIALIKLSTPVAFNNEIRPACLYQQYDTVPTQAWVSGWGVTEFGGEQSDKLQKALLNIVDNIACAIRHNQSIAIPYGITPNMICAGDPYGGWNKDTCQGDSGGPIQITNSQNACLFQVLGVTSFGQGCAVVNTPGVYTRVSHYLNWIEDIVWS